MTNATVSTRSRTITTSTATLADGTEIDLPYPADEMVDPFLTEDGLTFRYGVRDDSCFDFDWQEGVEFVQGSSRHLNYIGDADRANAWIEEMSVDHDVFSVDVYEHGGIMYSLSGGGPQCQFDTAVGGAAIAIPNEKHESPFTDTRAAAESILTEYTAWANGDVYGIVELTLVDGEWVEEDPACWQIYGYEYAEQCCKEGV